MDRRKNKQAEGQNHPVSSAICDDITSVKPLWFDDLSGRTLEEVLLSEAENRAWNKALRGRAAALVGSRLAKQISLETYAKRRQQANQDAAECRRRGTILVDEIRSRRGRSLPHSEL